MDDLERMLGEEVVVRYAEPSAQEIREIQGTLVGVVGPWVMLTNYIIKGTKARSKEKITIFEPVSIERKE